MRNSGTAAPDRDGFRARTRDRRVPAARAARLRRVAGCRDRRYRARRRSRGPRHRRSRAARARIPADPRAPPSPSRPRCATCGRSPRRRAAAGETEAAAGPHPARQRDRRQELAPGRMSIGAGRRRAERSAGNKANARSAATDRRVAATDRVRSSVAASAAIGVGVTTSWRVSALPIHCRSGFDVDGHGAMIRSPSDRWTIEKDAYGYAHCR